MDAFAAQGGLQFVVEQVVLFVYQAVCLNRCGCKGFGGRHAAVEDFAGIPLVFAPQVGHPYFKKFVKVGGDDAEEAQPLKQGDARILRLRQYAAVEFEQAQFAA